MTNKEKVIALLKSIETGASEPLAYVNLEKYIQHNLSMSDGLAGFAELSSLFRDSPVKVNPVRVFEDGDYVFAHVDYFLFTPTTGFDIFRLENGKIVEHWDNLQERPAAPSPSGHTMIDGSTEIKDRDKTDANKKLVRQFAEDVLELGNPGKLTSYIEGENYIQHKPDFADGLSGLSKGLVALAEQGMGMKHEKIHLVLGEGNFVLVVGEGTLGGKHVSYYDLFRVENGKIVEHWDVVEEILPKNKWKNANGKF